VERARRAVVAGDPVLVERRAARRIDRSGPGLAVARSSHVDVGPGALDGERAHEPLAVHRVVGDRRVGRGELRAGRRRVGRGRRQEAALPGSARVRRDGGADVGSGTALAPPDLERGDDGRSPGRAVGLDGALVLAVGIRVRVDGEPPRDDLAVRRDAVREIGADDVDPRAAVDPVAPAPGDLDAVGAPARDDAIGRRRGDDELGCGSAADRCGRSGRRERQQAEERKDAAHGAVPGYPRGGRVLACLRRLTRPCDRACARRGRVRTHCTRRARARTGRPPAARPRASSRLDACVATA
jgi:hypothetical protein